MASPPSSPGKRVTGGGLSNRVSFRRASNHLRLGLVGYPNAGKSSLYNMLLHTGKCPETVDDDGYSALIGQGLFTTVDPNITTFTMLDERLTYLRGVYAPVLEDQMEDDDEDSNADLMTTALLTIGAATTASNPQSTQRSAIGVQGATTSGSPQQRRLLFADNGAQHDTSTKPNALMDSHHSTGLTPRTARLAHKVPGAGNRITLIDTAAIVPGSLSNKGANGGVIAGLRSEMTRPFISLGPGGLPSTDLGSNLGLGYGDSLGILHADALVVVVRGFDDDMVTHYEETVDPLRDLQVIRRELMAKDVEKVEAQLLRLARFVVDGTGGSDSKFEYETLLRIWEHLTATTKGALTRRLVALLEKLTVESVRAGSVNIAEAEIAKPKFSSAKLKSPEKKIEMRFQWTDGIAARCLGSDIRTKSWSGGEADVITKHQFVTAKGLVVALNVTSNDYLRGPSRNPWYDRMREITTALRCPLVTFSIPFEEKYAINVREYGKEEYLRANPRHQTAIPNILQECLNCLELQQIYTLHTVGGEGGEKANEGILARGAMLAGEATGASEGLGNAQIQGLGATGDDDDDDEDDPLFGAGQGVTMEVTTVSTWMVPSGATIEDLCAIARGTETMRLIRKADVLAYDHLVENHGDIVKARLEGLVYSRNKAYILVDGDVVSNFMV